MDTSELVSGGIGAVAGAVVTQIGSWWTKRAEKAPDLQETLTHAVAGVVKHYTDALAAERNEAQALRAEVADLRRIIEDQSARIEEQSHRIADQSEEIGGLNAHVEALTDALTAAGLNPPPRRKRAPKSTEAGT